MPASPSILTPLQLNAGAGILQNQGLAVNVPMLSAIAAYGNTTLISPLLNCIGNAVSTRNIISDDTINSLNYLASNTCPALADSIPNSITIYANNVAGFTNVLTNSANTIMGNGDLSKFCQALSQSQGYNVQINTFVNSAINGQSYLGSTFTDMDSMITGSVSSVNLATTAFGQDMANLGAVINTNNLDNLGSPLALVQQIYSSVGILPTLSIAFVLSGVPQDIVVNLADPTTSVTDSIQKLMYNAMTQIVGDDLAQILTVLKVTTAGITTMADLLNPVKIFPNSFQTLTVPIGTEILPIYINDTGAVNPNLATKLPSYVLSIAS